MWPVPHPHRNLLAIALPDGTVTVVDGDCPHRGGPLSAGTLRDGAIVCPWHWYAFDVTTGRCRTAREADLPRHRVIERDDLLWVEVAARRQESWSQLLRRHARGG